MRILRGLCHLEVAVLDGPRAEIAEGGVDAAKTVKPLDVLEDSAPSGSPARPRAALDQTELDGGEEALGDGVVPAVAGRAEAGSNATGIREFGVATGPYRGGSGMVATPR